MVTKTREVSFNSFIWIIVSYGLFSVAHPYFAGGVYDLNHKFLCIFAILTAVWFVFINKNAKVSLKVLYPIVIVVLSWLCVAFTGQLTFSYFTKWIIFAVSFVFYGVVIANIGYVSERTYKYIFVCTVLQLLLHFAYSFNMQYYIRMSSGTYLILAFDNKNSTAMQLLFLGILLMLFIKKYIKMKEYGQIGLCSIMLLIDIYLLYKTGSRSSWIAVLFILPFLLWNKLNKLVNKKTIFIGISLPMIFAVIYIWIYKLGFEDLTILGRRLYNGREEMWLSVFEGFPFKWIFGMFEENTIGDGSKPFQLHNSWLDMIASYGILVTILYFSMVYKLLVSFIKKNKDPMNCFAVVCIIGLIIQSIGEAALVVGNRAIFVCLIFLFCNKEGIIENGSSKITVNRERNIASCDRCV